MKRLTQEQFEEWLKEVGGSIAVEEFNRLNSKGDFHLINGIISRSFDWSESDFRGDYWATIDVKYRKYFSALPEPVNRTLFDVLGLIKDIGEGQGICYIRLYGDGSCALYESMKVISDDFEIISSFPSSQEYINHLYDTISEYIENKK